MDIPKSIIENTGLPPVEEKPKVGSLSNILSGTHKERIEEEKTILLKYLPGKRPSVLFTGFWTGKFIKAAQDTIARAYRLQRRDFISTIQSSKTEHKPLPIGEGGTNARPSN